MKRSLPRFSGCRSLKEKPSVQALCPTLGPKEVIPFDSASPLSTETQITTLQLPAFTSW